MEPSWAQFDIVEQLVLTDTENKRDVIGRMGLIGERAIQIIMVGEEAGTRNVLDDDMNYLIRFKVGNL